VAKIPVKVAKEFNKADAKKSRSERWYGGKSK
jgi:hypothetical protein